MHERFWGVYVCEFLAWLQESMPNTLAHCALCVAPRGSLLYYTNTIYHFFFCHVCVDERTRYVLVHMSACVRMLTTTYMYIRY